MARLGNLAGIHTMENQNPSSKISAERTAEIDKKVIAWLQEGRRMEAIKYVRAELFLPFDKGADYVYAVQKANNVVVPGDTELNTRAGATQGPVFFIFLIVVTIFFLWLLKGCLY
jgi:hypothetical protein